MTKHSIHTFMICCLSLAARGCQKVANLLDTLIALEATVGCRFAKKHQILLISGLGSFGPGREHHALSGS